jgi:hypothetical protein
MNVELLRSGWKASDIIARLTELVEQYGDRYVYSTADWTVIRNIEPSEDGWKDVDEPFFVVEG